MLKASRKHHANFAAICVSIEVQSQLPAWYHLASDQCPITNTTSKCLLTKHNVATIADLLRILARLCNQNMNIHHFVLPNCPCTACEHNKSLNCINPHWCASEALERIHNIYPKLNPIHLSDSHDNLSLTRHHKARNKIE